MSIVKETAAIYNITVEDLLSKSRKTPLSEARHIIIWYLIRCEGLDERYAAKTVNVSRPSAITQFKKIEALRNIDKQIRANIHELLIRMTN